MHNNKEAVQHAEGDRRHGEEIHRSNGFTMVLQKSRPLLCRLRTPRRLPLPAQHGSLGNIKAKHLQFTMNPRRTPGRIVADHAKNQFAQFPADASSPHASLMPREPRPVQLEPGTVPATVSGWTRINACFQPGQSRRNTTQNSLSEAVGRGRECRRFNAESCCRSARFSNSRSRRERKHRVTVATRSLSRRSMRPVLHWNRPNWKPSLYT